MIKCQICGKEVPKLEDICCDGKYMICFECFADKYCPWLN